MQSSAASRKDTVPLNRNRECKRTYTGARLSGVACRWNGPSGVGCCCGQKTSASVPGWRSCYYF